ncbi:DUF3079 domain-containing protein [Oxalobacteraceae bacterium]|nr:DUF3079 domain-containing protein [Oxalobacteraceae bacterium]
MSGKKIFPLHPARPELLCWGCDRYCRATDMACGNGSDRTQHPCELFGEDWASFGLDAPQTVTQDGRDGPDAQDERKPPCRH